MVAFQAIAQAPMWAKTGGLLLIANEVRGVFVAAGIAADYRAHGLHLTQQLWLVGLVILPILAVWAWKRETTRRRIARRLAL